MKSSIIPVFMCVLACASARTIFGVAVPNYSCTSGSDDVGNHYPNSYDASSFFQCTEFGLVLMPCPTGLEFNVELDRCDWPSSEEVIPDKTEAPAPESSEEVVPDETEAPAPESSEEVIPDETEAPAPESSEEVVPDETEAPAPESDSEENTSTLSPDPIQPGCLVVSCDFHGQYIPNPSDCHSFYQCSWGVPHLQQCPMETATTRLVFNPQSKVCVWSWEHPCNEC